MGSHSSSSSKPVDETPAAYKALQQPFGDTLANLLQQYNGNNGNSNLVNGYQGNLVTPTTANENQTLGQLQATNNAIYNNQDTSRNALTNITNAGNTTQAQINTANQLSAANQNPTTQQSATDYLANLNSASNGAFSADPNNPIVQAYVAAAQRQTQDALNKTLSRQNPSQFALGGQQVQGKGSSAFTRAQLDAETKAQAQLGDIATNINYSNLNDANNRSASALGQYTTGQQNANLQSQQLESTAQQNAASNAIGASTAQSNINTQEVNQMVQNLQAQALPRLIQDLGVERGMEVFQNNINSLLQTFGIVSGTSQPTIANSSSSSSSSIANPFSPISVK